MASQRFQAIYVEEAANGHALTAQIIARLPACPVIPIRHYKDVYNRTNQNARWQKYHQALILAVKGNPLVYPGPRICQRFGHDRFYYSNLMLGCPFDCSYCYLQGLYPSAHLVIFVNLPDFANAIADLAAEPVYLALSHDADILALHGLVPLLDLLADQLNPQLPLTAEIRTKTASRAYFLKTPPFPPYVFAFTLAPDAVIRRYERFTPPLDARLAAAKAALACGHAVRFCFDPILIDPGADDAYLDFFRYLTGQIDPANLVDASYGFFRMPDPLYRRVARLRPDSPLFQNMVLGDDKTRSYAAGLRQPVLEKHLKLLRDWIGAEKVFLS